MKTIALMTLLIFNCVVMNAQNCFWAKSGGGNDYDKSKGIATDINGNVYATGYFPSQTITFGSIVLTKYAGSNSSAFVVKYDSHGNLLWAKSFGDKIETISNGIATDASNNVYLTGLFRDDSITFDSITLFNQHIGYSEVFVVKLDSGGNTIWAKQSIGSSDDNGNGITTDASGAVYVTGEFYGDSVAFGDTVLMNHTAGTATDLFIVKYDSFGNVQWAKRGGGAGTYSTTIGLSVATDSFNNVFFTGYFDYDTMMVDNTVIYHNSGNETEFIVKCDSGGNVQWGKGAIANGFGARGRGVVSDGSNVYITGQFDGHITFDSVSLVGSSGNDMFLVKYDPNGNVLWAKKAGGTSDDVGMSVANDVNNDVYVTGYFKSHSIAFDTIAVNNSSSTSNPPNLFIVKYDPNGNAIWAKSGVTACYGQGIAVQGTNNVYVTGYYQNSMTIGNVTLTNAGQDDIFVANTYSFSSSISSTNVTCNGGSNGTAGVTLSGGSFPFTYSWNNSDTTQNINNLGAGNYSVTISDANNCLQRDSTTITQPPADSVHICLVTVDSLSLHNIIVWDKTVFTTVDSFIVYREISTNNYQPIASIPFDSLSQFIDTVRTLYFPNTGDPNAGTYRYKIQVHDTCGNYSPLSPYHNTIYFINNGGTFSWPQLYTIENGSNPVTSYILLRDDNSNGNWHPVSSVTGTQQVVSDPQYSTYQSTASWRIETQWNIACTPTLRPAPNTNVLTTTYSSSLSNIYRYSVNAVNEYSLDNAVQSYPNPTDGNMTIHSSTLKIQNLEVQNIVGEVLYFSRNDSQQNTIQLNLSGFPQGIYFLHVKTPNGVAVRKIVKE